MRELTEPIAFLERIRPAFDLLKPGSYCMHWDGNGADVHVVFCFGRRCFKGTPDEVAHDVANEAQRLVLEAATGGE
jgi:hypothetical protein